jgi:hypothetical protein
MKDIKVGKQKPKKKHVPLPKNVEVNLTFDVETEPFLDASVFDDGIVETYVNVKAKKATIRIDRDD